MIRKKTAMNTARMSGKRHLELFAATGQIRRECKEEVEQLDAEFHQKFVEGAIKAQEYQEIRLLRDFIKANIK